MHSFYTEQSNTLRAPQQINNRNLRNNYNQQTYFCKINLYQISFLSNSVREWNMLSIAIRNNLSLFAFKAYLNRDILHAMLTMRRSSLIVDLVLYNVFADNNCFFGLPGPLSPYPITAFLSTLLREDYFSTNTELSINFPELSTYSFGLDS